MTPEPPHSRYNRAVFIIRLIDTLKVDVAIEYASLEDGRAIAASSVVSVDETQETRDLLDQFLAKGATDDAS